MKLIDYYKQDIANASGKEAKATRSRWHQVCKRHCHLRWLTSDALPPPTIRQVRVDVNDEFSETYPVTSVIYEGIIANVTNDELEELYRMTKPLRLQSPQ